MVLPLIMSKSLLWHKLVTSYVNRFSVWSIIITMLQLNGYHDIYNK